MLIIFPGAPVAALARSTLGARRWRRLFGQRSRLAPALWLLSDHGIYLMSNERVADPRSLALVHARGCDPAHDPDWQATTQSLLPAGHGLHELILVGEAFCRQAEHSAWLEILILPSRLQLDFRDRS